MDNISTTDQGSDHGDQEAEVVEEQDAAGEVRHKLHDCFILETGDLVEVDDEEDPGDAEEESEARVDDETERVETGPGVSE